MKLLLGYGFIANGYASIGFGFKQRCFQETAVWSIKPPLPWSLVRANSPWLGHLRWEHLERFATGFGYDAVGILAFQHYPEIISRTGLEPMGGIFRSDLPKAFGKHGRIFAYIYIFTTCT